MYCMSDTSVRTQRRHRIEVRVTPEQDALIRQAADLGGETVTSFILDTVTARATAVIEEHREMTLSNDAFDRFMKALDAPSAVVPELERLFRGHTALPEA